MNLTFKVFSKKASSKAPNVKSRLLHQVKHFLQILTSINYKWYDTALKLEQKTKNMGLAVASSVFRGQNRDVNCTTNKGLVIDRIKRNGIWSFPCEMFYWRRFHISNGRVHSVELGVSRYSICTVQLLEI